MQTKAVERSIASQAQTWTTGQFAPSGSGRPFMPGPSLYLGRLHDRNLTALLSTEIGENTLQEGQRWRNGRYATETSL